MMHSETGEDFDDMNAHHGPLRQDICMFIMIDKAEGKERGEGVDRTCPFGKFICSRIKKRRKPRVKIVTLKLC